MIQNLGNYLIWSENYRALADWYIEKLGFEVYGEINHPDDTGVSFKIGTGTSRLWIGQHSEVKGKNQDMHRHMINLNVDSVTQMYEELKAKGVRFLAEPFKAPTFDKYFATFYDLDDNLLQIVGDK
ncbi:MAG: VOC family protein [Weeksellaceae bacterium]